MAGGIGVGGTGGTFVPSPTIRPPKRGVPPVAVAAQVQIKFGMANLSWTETYYWQANTGVVDNVIFDARRMANARRAWLSPQCSINEVRCSEIQFDDADNILPSILRDQPLKDGDEHSFGPGGAVATGNAQYAQMILWRAQNLPWGFKRQIQTRGHPVSYWVYDPAKPYAPAFPPLLQTASQDWINILNGTSTGTLKMQGQWSIRGVPKDPSVQPRYPIVLVSAGTPPAANWQVTTLDPIPGLEPGDQVKIGGMRGMWARGLNRVCTVQTVSGVTI